MKPRRQHDGTGCAILVFGARAIALAAIVAVTLAGCERTERKPQTPHQSTNDNESVEPAKRDVVVFPEDMHVAETSVNEFIKTAMNVCTSGDYEAFRSLWSARQEPLERAEFDQAWSAVQEVRVLAVEPVALISTDAKEDAVPEATYGIAAHLRLDPERLTVQTKTERNVVLLLVREHEQWRLAKAPKPLRRWLKQKAGIEDDEA